MTYTPHPRTRPSGRRRPPADVVDVLLWQLAVDVAAAHRPDRDGNCTNLACAGRRGRCDASWYAERALHLARRQPDGPHPSAPADRARMEPAVGRAVVTTTRSRFTGWFSTKQQRQARRMPGAALVAA